MSTGKLFSGGKHAVLYATYRPRYPEVLRTTIMQYLRAGGGSNDLALDLGCGNGQGTMELADHFQRVIGSDISDAQISAASTHNPQVSFLVSPAEDMSYCKDNSVDLITSAQAMHWYDLKKFFTEVKRVLKPNGVLAVYGYAPPQLDITSANEKIQQFEKIFIDGGYFHENIRHCNNKYAEISLPFKDCKRIEDIPMTDVWTLEHVMNFLSTWSGYQMYMKSHPGSRIMEELHESLKQLYSGTSSDKIKINWPLFLLLGRN